MKKFLCLFIVLAVALAPMAGMAESKSTGLEDVQAKSLLLMESTTGEVLFEKNPDERLPIASVTKIMTMLLIMEALQSGKITMEQMVTASENACSMGGSQVYLEPGEQMSVHDLIKAIAVASGNDAAVAMAEQVMGSVPAFVKAMNDRGKMLGMTNTNFVNCNGLDEDNQYSSARDVAIMSRELLRHDAIRPFLGIWMDSLRGGEFALANTNKLIRTYPGAFGIKTGSTGKAKYCLSAAATRNDLTLIAVCLATENDKERFATATKLLNFGFDNYTFTRCVETQEVVGMVAVKKGVEEEVELVAGSAFSKLLPKGKGGKIEQQLVLPETCPAPLHKNDKVGDLLFLMDGKQIGRVDVVANQDIPRLNVGVVLMRLIRKWAMIG